MGILVKKKQTGGSLFADPGYMKLTADMPMQQPGSGKGQRGAVGRPRTTGDKTKSTESPLSGMLPSDIQYYKNEEARILGAIKAGFDKNEDFDSTPEYEALWRDKYELESVKAPQMKSMNKLYEKSYTKFGTNAAGDAPAILGNTALVKAVGTDPETGRQGIIYKAVSSDELLTNPSMYKVLTGQEILELRKSNAAFSGFTQLGKAADQIITTAYGSKSFNKDIDIALGNIGYTRKPGKFVNNLTKESLGLNNLEFDEKSKLVTKTNIGNLTSLHYALMKDQNNFSIYLKNKAIVNLQQKIASGVVKIDEKNSIGDLINRSVSTEIADRLISSLVQDENEARKRAEASGIGTKDKKGNIVKNTTTQLLQNTHRIEIPNINATDDKSVGSLMHVLPAGYVFMGGQYLEYGFGENIKDDEDEDVSVGNRRTLNNNSVITDMKGGQTLMTTYGGVEIKNIVDNKELQNATIPPNANLHIVLAPVIKDPQTGKLRVDFTNEFTPQMMQAIKTTYELLEKEKITSADMAKKSPEIMKKAQAIAQKELIKLLGKGITNPPQIRATFAFDILYEADNTTYNKNEYGWDSNNADYLYSVIEEDFWRVPDRNYARETIAFIPISDGYWSAMLKQGSLPGNFETSIAASEVEGAIKSSAQVTDIINIGSVADYQASEQYKKKHGGKLASTEEVRNLLFNN